jgi:hypothetical protein
MKKRKSYKEVRAITRRRRIRRREHSIIAHGSVV